MKTERTQTTITLQDNDEHRAVRFAMLLASAAITNAQRTNVISRDLVLAGAVPLMLIDLVSLRDTLDKIAESLGDC